MQSYIVETQLPPPPHVSDSVKAGKAAISSSQDHWDAVHEKRLSFD